MALQLIENLKTIDSLDSYDTIRVKSMPNQAKIAKTMHEFKHGTLRSGSKTGPKVESRSQAIAIALNQARKGGK